MRRTAKPVIVIPVYRCIANWDANEQLSFERCITIFSKHLIVFVGPKKLNWAELISYVSNIYNLNIDYIFFDNEFFKDIAGYNTLLKSSFFLNAFKCNSHLLIYQLDAFVFKDELEYWCKSGYDYIGAPWCGNYFYENKVITGVGNGGFSLRNIKASLSLLRKLRYLEVLEEYKNFNNAGIIPRIPTLFYKLCKAKNKLSDFEKKYSYQEDVFWGLAAPKRLDSFSGHSKLLKYIASFFIRNDFNIAPVEIALKFSFETTPKQLYKRNNEQLPFGCHAWEKYDPEFWKPFIQKMVEKE